MGSHVTIRDFEIADVFELRRLVEENADDMNLPEDTVEEKVVGFLRGWHRFDDILVAEYYGALVGFVMAHRGRSFATGRTASLRVVVSRPYRGMGVGARLVEAMLADLGPYVQRLEATPYLTDMDGGNPIVRWWEKRGFFLESIKSRGARLLDGSFTNVAVMVLLREEAVG